MFLLNHIYIYTSVTYSVSFVYELSMFERGAVAGRVGLPEGRDCFIFVAILSTAA